MAAKKTARKSTAPTTVRPAGELEKFAKLMLGHLEADTFAGADGESLHSATYVAPAPFTVEEKRRVLELMLAQLGGAA